MNYIDAAVLLIIGFSCFQGYRRGFIKTLFDTLGVIVAFFLSKEFYYLMEDFLMDNTKLFTKVHDFIETKSSINFIESVDKLFNVPSELQNILSNIIKTGDLTQADTFQVFVNNISIIVVRSISFIITFLIIYAILVALSNLINLIFKLPILNITNRIFGAGTGFVKGIIILYIIFALSSPLIGFMQENGVAKDVLSSESSKIFYNNNIILNYLSYKGFYNN
ncbi:CvpA family protein [Sedimentibacter hydroxybenzoicus DSM 7310]|uniref:CvpA family protein n=1 Tax=Sedimentibacter hydroxybenzoicus DSM 7310 TaxID=1123245 RepID=A0A974BH24_SEDHY|nr:CvpA family protein [Sedimentibacter hydroxybenzoicus]NYB73020.1 CvpA family protein [Sedimentibacter hydroxybenzoicus DSM 7310]